MTKRRYPAPSGGGSTPAVRIRRARARDAKAIERLFIAFRAQFGIGPGEFKARHFLRDGMGRGAIFSTLLAIAPDGRPIGFAVWHPTYDTDRGVPGAYLMDLFVEAEWRRQGVARALMDRVAHEVARKGGAFIFWATGRTNRRAQTFYRAIGAENDDVMIFVLKDKGFRRAAARAA